MSKSKNKNQMNLVRREWSRDPSEKVHSTPKGNRGYNRNKYREQINEEYISELLEEEYLRLIKKV